MPFARFAEVVREDDPTNNVPDSVFSKIGVQLHRRDDHPLGIIKNEIYRYFDEKYPGLFQKFEDQSPIVSVKAVSCGSHELQLVLVCTAGW